LNTSIDPLHFLLLLLHLLHFKMEKKILQNAKEKMKSNLINRHILLVPEVEHPLKNAIANEGERITMKKGETKVIVEIEKEVEAGINQNQGVEVVVVVVVELGIKKIKTLKKNKTLPNKCKN
jgi:hypothetical protein